MTPSSFRTKKWRSGLDPERRRALNKKAALKQLYNLGLEEFDEMLREQGSCCAICGLFFDGISKNSTPHVDHDHRTKRIRKLLCNPCNRMLGEAGDDPFRLRVAADYIEAHQ